jgi:hypothetical protein
MRAMILLAVLAGCYKATFQLAPTTGPTFHSPVHDNDFHVSVVGVIELSSPIDLATSCGGGTAPVSIDERIGALGALANFALGLYVPADVFNPTVDCGARSGPPGLVGAE